MVRVRLEVPRTMADLPYSNKVNALAIIGAITLYARRQRQQPTLQINPMSDKYLAFRKQTVFYETRV
ncbi:MAG: hypothetical protein QW331_02285 [Candidatus Woesearchaeota archaeon]